MKLPFTLAELSATDKEWLEKVPAAAVWDFVETLSKLERLPFDDPYYAPSGADFMKQYGHRLRAFVSEHPTGFELTAEEMAELGADLDWDIPKEVEEATLLEEMENQKLLTEEKISLKEYDRRQVEIAQKYIRAGGMKAQNYLSKRNALAERHSQELAQFSPNGVLDTPDATVHALLRRQQAETLTAAKNFREHQSAQDKKIAELEAMVAKLTEERDAALKERDAARLAYLKLLDQQAKRDK